MKLKDLDDDIAWTNREKILFGNSLVRLCSVVFIQSNFKKVIKALQRVTVQNG